MHEAGQKIESLRALYDMWVDASEEAYGEFVMSDEYQVVYGDLVNSLMRVRKDMNDLAEQHYQLMNIPTRSEIDTVQRRQQEQRREPSAAARDHRSCGHRSSSWPGPDRKRRGRNSEAKGTGTGPAADR